MSPPSPRAHSELLLSGWARLVCRRAALVVIATTILTGLAGYYAAGHLGVNTDIVDLFDADLPFRRAEAAYRARFIDGTDALLVVIDGQAPELVAAAGRALATKLAGETDVIETVVRPRGDAFLQTHAFLYLDPDDLDDLAERLVESQPFLGRLTRDCSLRAFCGLLVDILESDTVDGVDVDIEPVLLGTQEAVDATLDGRVHFVSWQELISGEDATDAERRDVQIVRPRLDYGSMRAGGPAIERIREVAATLGIDAAHGLRVRITGTVALRHEELRTLRDGAVLSTTLAFVLVAIVLFVGLRSLRLMAISLIALVVGLAWTAAFAAFAVGSLNLISVAFGVLYIGLGIDFAIHLGLRTQELFAEGRSTTDAVIEAVGDVGGAIALCAITTSIAFYAFVPTSFRGVSELGLIAGTGMLISLGVTLTVLPALLTLTGFRARRRTPGSSPRPLDLSTRRPRLVVAAAVVLAGCTLPLLGRVRFDSDPLHLRDAASESVATLEDLLAEGEASPWHIVVLADSDEQATALHARLATLETVDHVVALADFVPAQQEEKLEVIDDLGLVLGSEMWWSNPLSPPDAVEQIASIESLAAALEIAAMDDPAIGTTAASLATRLRVLLADIASQDAARQAAVLSALQGALLDAFPANIRQLTAALDAGPVDHETLPATLVERWRSADGVHRITVFPVHSMLDPEALREFSAEVRAVAPDAIGAPVIHLAATDAVISSFRQALVVAFIPIAILLLFVLRSVTLSIVVLVPVFLAGLLLAAATVLADAPFNFANIIAVPLLIGMGVDSGIHMVRRHAVATGDVNVLATSTSRAVFYSGLTTIAGFGALSVSTHPGMASLGKLLTLGILFVLFATLIVVPALLGCGRGDAGAEQAG